jgi:hypothetical protein
MSATVRALVTRTRIVGLRVRLIGWLTLIRPTVSACRGDTGWPPASLLPTDTGGNPI